MNVDDRQCAASVLLVLSAILHTNYLSIICSPSVASWLCLFFQVFIPENSFLLCSLVDMISFDLYTEWKAVHSLLTMADSFVEYFSLADNYDLSELAEDWTISLALTLYFLFSQWLILLIP